MRPNGRLRGWRAALPWLVLGLELAWILIVVVAYGPDASTGPFGVVMFLVIFGILGIVGALVATRQPRNPVGWLLYVAALLVGTFMAGQYAEWSRTTFGGGLPLTVPIAWLQGLTFLPAVILIVVMVPFSFPDGRLLSPRWRWAVLLGIVGVVIAELPSAFDPGLLTNTQIENPLGIAGFKQYDLALGIANYLIALVAFLLAMLSIVLRYRRGTPVVRQQLKWFAAALGWALTWLVLSIVGSGIGVQLLSDLGWLLGILGLLLLPIAIGIAILRYRLYDIDRIVSRTLAWAIVTGLLVGAFAILVVGLQALLAPITEESTLAVAISTLAAAALFQPLRSRVQRAVDRRFNRSRYDADRLASAFATRLRDEVDLSTVSDDLLATTREALGPSTAGVWVRAGTEARA
ncbi:MAG: hypothetical protein U0869_17090 [Chloroflexota bacterium]